jgi:hypothetical protein
MAKCDRCKSEHLKTKPYRKESFTGPEESYQIKTTIENLCEDCYKTTAREKAPMFKKLNEAQALLDGEGDLEEEED